MDVAPRWPLDENLKKCRKNSKINLIFDPKSAYEKNIFKAKLFSMIKKKVKRRKQSEIGNFVVESIAFVNIIFFFKFSSDSI